MWFLTMMDREGPDWAPPDIDPPEAPAPVVGGTEATPGRWPDAAALYTAEGTFGCTGTLIAPDLVLTAGHCGFGMDYVVVGTDDQRDPEQGETVPILESLVHEDHTTTFDIAVLVLESDVQNVTHAVNTPSQACTVAPGSSVSGTIDGTSPVNEVWRTNARRAGETADISAAGRGTSCSAMAASSASSARSSARKPEVRQGVGRIQAASASVAAARVMAVHS